MKIRHYINGQDLGEPKNWRDLEITIDWRNAENNSINLTDLEFYKEAKRYLHERILNGLNGGVGIFEGEPYEIRIGDQNTPIFSFNGYLDFTDDLTRLGDESIFCSLKKVKGEDWLNDVADSFSFAYLYDKGIINDSDFKKVPYVINYIPDGLQLIILSMSIYMMTKELIENAQKVAETIADLTDASTPVLGVSVGVGAGVVTAWDIGNYILAALKLIARIAYVIAITIAIKNLIEQIFEQLLPKKRYHLGMTFRKMFEKACEYLNLSFNSDISELNRVYIPNKSKEGGKSGETGFPTNSSSIYGFGDFVRTMKQKFNADFRIKDGVFYFKRKDKFDFQSNYQMPEYFNDQEKLLTVDRFNTEEMISNYNITYAYDVQDQNTLDNVEGQVFQAITTPQIKQNEDLVNIKGFNEIALPFSLGVRKNSLTDIEKIAKDLGGIVDDLTGIFGGGTNFKSKIQNRVGSLLLSSHFITVGKVVEMQGSKLANNQREKLSALNLWEKYHFINSFAEYKNGIHNQYFIFENNPVPMDLEDFSKLLEDNKATDSKGNEYEIDKVVYTPYTRKAIIDFRIKKKYTNNLKIEIVT